VDEPIGARRPSKARRDLCLCHALGMASKCLIDQQSAAAPATEPCAPHIAVSVMAPRDDSPPSVHHARAGMLLRVGTSLTVRRPSIDHERGGKWPAQDIHKRRSVVHTYPACAGHDPHATGDRCRPGQADPSCRPPRHAGTTEQTHLHAASPTGFTLVSAKSEVTRDDHRDGRTFHGSFFRTFHRRTRGFSSFSPVWCANCPRGTVKMINRKHEKAR
jgi:hypothetical protein